MSSLTDNVDSTYSDVTLQQSAVALLQAIQQAQAAFVDTINKLEEHNLYADAHPAILAKITEIATGSGFVLTEDMITTITEAISAHNTDNTATHVLFRADVTALTDRIAVLEAKIEELQPTPEEPDPTTELQEKLAAIDAEYDPLLESIKDSWTAASMAGKTDTATAFAEQYSALMEEKTAAINAVMAEYTYVD